MCSDINEETAQPEALPNGRIKAWVQNFLGGLVLLALPTVPGAVFVGWGTLTSLSNKQEQLAIQFANMEQKFEREHAYLREQFYELRNNHNERIKKLEDWKEVTSSNRFRSSDGDRLSGRIDRNSHRIDDIENAQHAHDREAQKYIAIIERNTPLIFENRRKSHTH